MKILIADDSKTSLAVLAATLKDLGHQVLPASSGHEAVSLFKKVRPDLIILDVVMEKMDGFECARQIRLIDSEDWIPIIFLSGSVDDVNISKGIDAGGDDYLTKPFSEITLAAKIKAMQRIADMRTKLFTMTKILKTLSVTDALTGLYNRAQFDQVIAHKLAESKISQQALVLLFMDLDKFKLVNDTLGHQVGDLLLIEVGKRLKASLGLSDFIARIGGDEFAIILEEIHDLAGAKKVAEKIIKELSAEYHLKDYTATIGASIGISICPSAHTTPLNFIQNADEAMYHAKKIGPNLCFYYEDIKDQVKLL